jgi:hypothetical protein
MWRALQFVLLVEICSYMIVVIYVLFIQPSRNKLLSSMINIPEITAISTHIIKSLFGTNGFWSDTSIQSRTSFEFGFFTHNKYYI